MACRQRLASTAAFLAAEPTLQRRSESFASTSRIPTPTRSETAQNPKRNHPRPSFLETSRLDGATPPEPPRCTPRRTSVRHNVQTGTTVTQRTLREWAERPVAKKHDDVMWRLEQWHRQRTRPPPRNHAAFCGLATVSVLVAFLILHSVC